MRKFAWFLRLIPLLVVLPAALLLSGGGAVDAQDGLPPIADVRDLSVRLDTEQITSPNLYVYVYNNSTTPMRNVQVRLTTDPPEARARLISGPPLRPSADEARLTYDPSTGIITFPELSATAAHFSNDAKVFIGDGGYRGIVKVRAEIIGSVPAEDATQLDNNQAELWVYFTSVGDFPVRSNTSISVRVVNRSPAQNENHVFSVTAAEVTSIDNETYNYDEDVVVKVALSEGLAFASGQSATSGTSFSRTSPTTGLWRLGRGARVTGQLEIPVRLSTDVGAAPPLNRRCLSAQIVGGRPPATAHPVHGKVRTACLGARKPIVFSDGDLIITPSGCQPPVAYPCREGETLILTVDMGPDSYRSEDVTFLVDPVAHQTAGTINGTTWLWSTGQALSSGHDNYDLPGVRLTRATAANTIGNSRKFTISDVSPKERPGTIAVIDRYLQSGNPTLYEALNPDKNDKLTDSLQDTWGQHYKHLVVFSEPGVYKVILGVEWTRISDSSVLSVSGTLNFIVGAVADLQVHDAGRHGALPRGQQAYTLRAWNNLDETVEQVEVALTGVPRGAVPEVSSDGGRYDRGACDENGLCEGIWKIGELESWDYRYLSGRSDGPTLTLLVDGDDPKPITATITSEQTRTVTAGGNSYTIEVIDLDDSNSKDVSIAVGTGRGEPDPEVPESLRVDQFGQIALLRWDTVEEVSRWPVAYYQVQRGNQVLDVEAKDPLYLDLRARGGNSVYRVRAVSDQGIAGPWSRPAGGTDVLAQTAGLAAPNGLTATPGLGDARRIDLSWFAPSGETGLRYIIEHAAESPGPWTTLAHGYSGATYSHTGAILLPGTTHYYRVAAARGSDTGPWAYVQATLAAAADGTVFYAPGWPENLRFTSLERTAVTLAWDPPADDGGRRITGYEYRVSGPCPSGADDVCDIVAPRRVSGTSVRISGLNRESPPPYQFEVRALNAVGASDWSQPISKHVGPATAGGGRVTFSPSRLTVAEGGEATYRVKLSRAPTLPLYVVLHPDGDGYDNLAGNLHSQQFKILLPSGYDTSGLTNDWCDGNSIRFDWNEAYAWNVGAPITVVADEDDDSEHETLTIRHTLYTVPADCLGMTPKEDGGEWAPDPVYDDMHGIALTVTERDND